MRGPERAPSTSSPKGPDRRTASPVIRRSAIARAGATTGPPRPTATLYGSRRSSSPRRVISRRICRRRLAPAGTRAVPSATGQRASRRSGPARTTTTSGRCSAGGVIYRRRPLGRRTSQTAANCPHFHGLAEGQPPCLYSLARTRCDGCTIQVPLQERVPWPVASSWLRFSRTSRRPSA